MVFVHHNQTARSKASQLHAKLASDVSLMVATEFILLNWRWQVGKDPIEFDFSSFILKKALSSALGAMAMAMLRLKH